MHVPVDLGGARARLVRWRWAIALGAGLSLVVAKRAWQSTDEPPDPLIVNGVLYIAAPVMLALALGWKRADIGLALPKGRTAWAIVAVLLAVAFALAFAGTLFPAMMEYYPEPIWGEVEPTVASFVPYEAAIAVIMLAVELLFRGLLVLAVSERLGRWAIVVSAVPYALAHLGKPPEEVVFSLVAGLAFGWADLKARSILPSFAAHFTGSALFDLLALQG